MKYRKIDRLVKGVVDKFVKGTAPDVERESGARQRRSALSSLEELPALAAAAVAVRVYQALQARGVADESAAWVRVLGGRGEDVL